MTATVEPDGRVRVGNEIYKSLSIAAGAARVAVKGPPPDGYRARLIRQQRERETERAFSQIASVTARSDAVILDALTELLAGDRYRRLIGPALIASGLLIGTIANVAAL